MNIKKIIKFTALLGLTIVIAGCGSSAQATPTLDPVMVMTEVAGTVQAEITQSALLTPSATLPPPPTSTPLPVPTLPVPASAPTTPAGTSGQPSTGGLPAISPDNAIFIEDVETPDDKVFEPGDRFTKKWKIENTGTTIWNTEYRLIYYSGVPIMADEADMIIYLQQSVDPANQLTLSVRMTAPDVRGTYENHFRMVNDKGQVFGDNLYVRIIVGTWDEKHAWEEAHP